MPVDERPKWSDSDYYSSKLGKFERVSRWVREEEERKHNRLPFPEDHKERRIPAGGDEQECIRVPEPSVRSLFADAFESSALTATEVERRALLNLASVLEEFRLRDGTDILGVDCGEYVDFEDDTRQIVVTVLAKMDSPSALQFWDRIAEVVHGWVNMQPESIRASLGNDLSISVQW